jgi:hypothetical protein
LPQPHLFAGQLITRHSAGATLPVVQSKTDHPRIAGWATLLVFDELDFHAILPHQPIGTKSWNF